MAETNIAYATDSSVFTALEALVLHNLPDFGKHGDGITNNNFLLARLKQKDMFVVMEGGLEIWHGVLNAENSNAKWQAHTASMSANLQDPSDRLRFPIKTFTASIVINELHEAMNKGRAMKKDWSRTLTRQAKQTIPNQFNSAFWATSPGANEPESIPNLISTTPTTGTVGGQSRSANEAYQNGVDATSVTDIGAENGIKQMEINRTKFARGSGGKDSVDTIIMGNERWASLQAYLTTQNRFRPDDDLAKLHFDTIRLNTAVISYENTNTRGTVNTINADYVYGLNANHLFFKVLRDGNFKWADKFERVGQSLNKALYFKVFGNLSTDLLDVHFVMTNVTG